MMVMWEIWGDIQSTVSLFYFNKQWTFMFNKQWTSMLKQRAVKKIEVVFEGKEIPGKREWKRIKIHLRGWENEKKLLNSFKFVLLYKIQAALLSCVCLVSILITVDCPAWLAFLQVFLNSYLLMYACNFLCRPDLERFHHRIRTLITLHQTTFYMVNF